MSIPESTVDTDSQGSGSAFAPPEEHIMYYAEFIKVAETTARDGGVCLWRKRVQLSFSLEAPFAKTRGSHRSAMLIQAPSESHAFGIFATCT